MTKRYFWLRLKDDFFKSKAMKKLRRIAGGDTYTIIYLKLMLLSLMDEGRLYFEGIEPTFYEEMALALDEDAENVQATLLFLESAGLMRQENNTEYLLVEVPGLIGSETAVAERVRRHREKNAVEKEEKPKIEAKTNAERQSAHRAKKFCEQKQHIPLIEDHANKERYNGYYYIVLKRDECKCRLCGSIENLCVHHIDGFSEEKPQNSEANKMITLCRSCHIRIHRREGFDIPSDILESIGYFDSNVTLPGNVYVTTCNTEIEKEIDIEKDKRKEKTRTVFIKPSVEEIEDYCLERGNGIDPGEFYDFYESKGWMIGKNKMKDWKAAIRTWERGSKKTHTNAKSDLDDFYNMANEWAKGDL